MTSINEFNFDLFLFKELFLYDFKIYSTKISVETTYRLNVLENINNNQF